jgi:hypothetical protein
MRPFGRCGECEGTAYIKPEPARSRNPGSGTGIAQAADRPEVLPGDTLPWADSDSWLWKDTSTAPVSCQVLQWYPILLAAEYPS